MQQHLVFPPLMIVILMIRVKIVIKIIFRRR